MREKLGASHSGSQIRTVFSVLFGGKKPVLRFESHHSYTLLIARFDFLSFTATQVGDGKCLFSALRSRGGWKEPSQARSGCQLQGCSSQLTRIIPLHPSHLPDAASTCPKAQASLEERVPASPGWRSRWGACSRPPWAVSPADPGKRRALEEPACRPLCSGCRQVSAGEQEVCFQRQRGEPLPSKQMTSPSEPAPKNTPSFLLQLGFRHSADSSRPGGLIFCS